MGKIFGSGATGGIAGLNFHNISFCSFNGEVFGQLNVGGLVGRVLSGMITKCKTECSIFGKIRVGGLCGYVKNDLINQCYSSGNVEGANSVGGLVGYHFRGLINNSYSLANVIGEEEVGGFVGFNSDEITYCYSSGEVKGTYYVGGFAGYDYGITTNSFWNVETSNQISSDGGTGLNTSEMKKQNNYLNSNWDFDQIWYNLESKSYPILRTFDYNLNIIKLNNTLIEEDSMLNLFCDISTNIPGLNNPIWMINSNASSWLSIDTNGIIFGLPGNEDVGSFWVNVTSKFNGTIFDFSNFTLTVHNINDDPKILTEELPSAFENKEYSVIIEKMDEDPTNDQLTWRFNTNTEFLNFEDDNGRLFGNPSIKDVGNWWVLLNLSDGNGGFDEKNFSLSVKLFNDPPIISDITIPDLIEDTDFTINFEATDVDSSQDQFEWYIITDASFVNINKHTGELHGTPENSDVGNWWVIINLSDGSGGFDELNISLKVININDNPIILNFENHDINEDDPFFIDHEAIDIDPTDDILIWEMETSSTFIKINSKTGNITGTPSNDDVGIWWVKITVYDGNGGEDSKNYTITVRNTNDAPELKQTNVSFSMKEDSMGVTFDLNDYFYDIEKNALFFDFIDPNNLTISETDDIVDVIPKLNWFGIEEVEFSANDGLLTTILTVRFEVVSVNDAPSDVEIIAQSSYYENGNQWVNSSAVDVDIPYGDFLTYRWSSDLVGEIGYGQSINLSLPSGDHLITLNVTDKEGLSQEVTKEINIIALRDNKSSNDGRKSSIIFGILIIISILVLTCVIVIFFIRKKIKNSDSIGSSTFFSNRNELISPQISEQSQNVTELEVKND